MHCPSRFRQAPHTEASRKGLVIQLLSLAYRSWLGPLLGGFLVFSAAGCQAPAGCPSSAGLQSSAGLRLTQRISDTSANGSFESNDADGSLEFADVGLDSSQLTYELRAEVDLGQVVVMADYRRIALDGSGPLANDFAVNGVTFDAGASVQADTAIKLMRGLVLWKLLPTSSLDLDLGFGVAGLDTRFALRDIASGDSVSADELGLTPFFAGRAKYRLGDFELEGQAGYIESSFDLTELYYLNLELAGRWRFAGASEGFSAWAEAGYRRTDITVDFLNDPAQVDIDLGLNGPFVGLVIQF